MSLLPFEGRAIAFESWVRGGRSRPSRCAVVSTAIALMMVWLRRASFLPFVIYRLALGAALLWMLHKGYFAGWTPA